MKKSTKERFFEKVQVGAPDECWLWTGAKSSGYGRIKVKGKAVEASRLAYVMQKGEIPGDHYLYHTCHNPSCVNVGHLLVETTQDRFWKNVDKTEEGCWLWTGTTTSKGYGYLKIGRKNMLAHRLSYMWNTGPIPDGLFILHRCDTPACIRPDHLYVGDNSRNTRDFFERGPKGRRKKLTPEEVREIRRGKGTMTQTKIAQVFGVTPQTIGRILSGKRWGWLEAA